MKPVLTRCHPRLAEKPYAPDVLFHCPGCKTQHGVWTDKPASNGARWSWNGDMERPTFSPSLLITVEWREADGMHRQVCHSFVREGQIQFLSDCTHALAGQTVPLQPL